MLANKAQERNQDEFTCLKVSEVENSGLGKVRFVGTCAVSKALVSVEKHDACALGI